MEQPINPDENTKVEAEEEHPQEEEQRYGAPTGAFVFAILMFLAYVIYYLVHWFEIFVVRGG